MNRIYQGRVVKVEKLKTGRSADDWEPFDPDRKIAREKWQEALWRHHEMFQDAVNYYTLALAAMAEGVDKSTPEGKALADWRAQVKENWLDGRRKAIRYPGPHRRLSQWLGVDPNISDEHKAFETSAEATLFKNGSTLIQRSAALFRLLNEADDNDLNQVSRDRIVPLCSPPGKCDATPKDLVASQVNKMLDFVKRLHTHIGPNWNDIAAEFEPGWFVARMPVKLLKGQDALKEALKRFQMATKDDSLLKGKEKIFEEHICKHGNTHSLYTPGRKVKGPYSIAVVFKLWPTQLTAEVLKRATSFYLKQKPPEIELDPIFVARVKDHPLFDYFTNRCFYRDPGDKNQAVWKDFDIAAFLEAIKAPHRYFQDSKKRKAAADKLRAELTTLEGQGRLAKGDEDDGEQSDLDGFAEDTRILKVIELVFLELGCHAEVEAVGEALPLREFIEKSLEKQKIKLHSSQREYTIRERTLRGWSVIRDKWRSLAENGEATPERLWSVVVSEQGALRDEFGSAPLYKKLAEPLYHPIWRDKGTRPWHADDPLRAWLQYTELRLELADKTRPIRFTPAHAVYSPRYFIFPKKSAAGGRWGSEHETGALAFTAGIALRDGEKWRPQMVRFEYSAPRLRRDELRRADEQSLDSAPWLQPIMKALGLPEPARQNFGNCRITLQPTKPDDIQLTFPVEVEPEKLIEFLGGYNKWNVGVVGKERKKRFLQFNLSADQDQFETSLRWPSDIEFAKEAGKGRKSEPNPAWHEKLDRFMVLSVDLGQREAGAYALLDIHANHDFGKKSFRFIGETPGKKWRAALTANGLFRLPGEDRDEWRAKTTRDIDNKELFGFREELHGGRGRMSRDFETEECRNLLNAFLGENDLKAFIHVGWDDPQSPARLSFPEQNDKLLIAARRAQSRVARLHRWCWFLNDNKKRKDALAEIREALDTSGDEVEHWLPIHLKEYADKDNDPRLLGELKKLLEMRLKELPDLMVRLAKRILPLRGRSWKWESHPQASNNNRIYLLTQNGPSLDSKESPVWLRGQRGLSMKRIEQIEELRKRFQSLNQTLRRDIGDKPPLRRDESIPDPCPDLLVKLDNLKEQRVNQTAHMILAESLGVRLAEPPRNKPILKAERDQHGIYKKFREPVDLIVIEDLSRYRASQGRAPRENSRLMKWCHRAVRDKLRELCEPFGIPVLETPAAYSSRFCSRTGVPGFRAVEVTAGFEEEVPWCWLKDKKDGNGKVTEEAQFIRSTAEQLHAAQREMESLWKPKRLGQMPPRRTLLVPQAGGQIFVPAVDFDGNQLRSAVVQADVNAAINLGLRAIADPRLWDIHPRLRTERLSGEARRRGDKKKSREVSNGATGSADDPVRLKAREKRKYGENGPELVLNNVPKGSAVEDSRNPNYFCDIAGLARQLWKIPEPEDAEARRSINFARVLAGRDTVHIADPLRGNSLELLTGKAFWGAVKKLQWPRCQEINNSRLAAWRSKSKAS